MTGARTLHNIALIGFMGTGKSSVGRVIAEQLHFHFVDTDELIEVRARMSISSIFATQGEAAFRQLEKETLAELATLRETVIATGGGLGAQPANVASLKQHAMVACLWASPEKIWERVHGQSHRPLLRAPNPLARIRELLAGREPHYKEADVLLNTDLRSLREVAQQAMHHFQAMRANP